MRSLKSFTLAGFALLFGGSISMAAGPAKLPKVAEGWKIELVAEAPQILFPTAVVAASDGTIYLGQDPMDMPGPPTTPSDSVVALKDGKVRVFADGLWAVMGLEWIDGTLYVVHPPFLSAFTDTDGDGKADKRVDLVTGLGPKIPGFSGINDHVASGTRLAMDGFLYIAIGDKGIPKATGLDGKTITMKGGGVVRVRPNGSDLEIVSTGERNPLSVVLNNNDDVFTYGNDDDSKKWPNSFTHHIVGAHFGYPYEFLTAPWRTLPITAGQLGGSGTQGVFYGETGLPPEYRGNLFFCDWALSTVFRYQIEENGATFKLIKRAPIVEKGEMVDFRPFSVGLDADRAGLLVVDWGYNNWLASGVQTGRLYRLTHTKMSIPTKPSGQPMTDLQSSSPILRMQAQRDLAKAGVGREAELIRLLEAEGPATPRIHALWALDAIGSPSGAAAIRNVFKTGDQLVRSQGAKRSGLRGDKEALTGLEALLADRSPVVRREAAIALARVGNKASSGALFKALGDKDSFVDWSVRQAIRRTGAWDSQELASALLDRKKRESALSLADESWAIPAIEGLLQAYASNPDADTRARIVINLAGQMLKYPEWNGNWFGTNPLAGDFPAKTLPWDLAGMELVKKGLVDATKDKDVSVRHAGILGLASSGSAALTNLLAVFRDETNEANRVAIIGALGRLKDARLVVFFADIVKRKTEVLPVRAAALDALAQFGSREAVNARFSVVFDSAAPPELVSRALPMLGQSGVLPANDMAGFLTAKSPLVRIAALLALSDRKTVPEAVRTQVVDCLSDADREVQMAAIETVARLKIANAVEPLIALAKNPATRTETTQALASMPDPRALSVFIDAISDKNPDMRRAGQSALLGIKDRVSDDLRKLAASGKLEANAMGVIERVLTKFQPLTKWKVIGPFARTTARVFVGEPSIDFEKAYSGAGGPIKWIDRGGDAQNGRVLIEDFKGGIGDRGGFGYDTNGSPDLAAFVYAEIESATDRPAMLLLGTSGSVIMTLNEKTIYNYTNFAGRSFDPGSDMIRVNLVKGKNRILMRVRQGIGMWSFSVQVSEPSDALFASKRVVGLEELRTFAINHTGDIRKGEELFFDAKGVGCMKCHAANGRGTGNIGPDLTGLALKYDKEEIVRSVLEPSARIATGYQPVLVSTNDGRVITGLLKNESETHLELVDSETKVSRVPKADIDERRVGSVSVMPAGLAETLPPIDFADLVAYLTSLKAAPKK